MKKKYSGRFLMLFGAIFLLIWSCYELCIRCETLYANCMGMYNVVKVVHPEDSFWSYFWDYLVEEHMVREWSTLGFLLMCGVLSIMGVCLRNRPRAGFVIIALDLFICLIGWKVMGLFGFSILNWTAIMKIIPLLLIVAGCMMNLAHYYYLLEQSKLNHVMKPESVEKQANSKSWKEEMERYLDIPSNREMARRVQKKRISDPGDTQEWRAVAPSYREKSGNRQAQNHRGSDIGRNMQYYYCSDIPSNREMTREIREIRRKRRAS